MLQAAHSRIGVALGPESAALPIRIEWARTPDEFASRLTIPAEHTMAAAVPTERRIIINATAFNGAEPLERQVTISHEYVHLFLGTHCAEPLPLWLDEGLAMHLSGDTGYAGSFRLTVANSLGRLIPLMELRSSFPYATASRDMAYREAWSVTAYYLRTAFPESGASGLVRQLVDAGPGPKLIASLWDKPATSALESAWRRSLNSLGSWIGVATSPTLLWGGITLLFLLAYWKRRRQKKAEERETEEDGDEG